MAVLGIVAPIYLAVAIGYLFVRRGIVPRAAMTPLSQFIVNVALPALLFGAIATRPITEVVQPTYLLAYALGSVVAMAVAFVMARRVGVEDARVRRLRAAYSALGAGTSNSGYVGLPLLTAALPSIAAPAFAMNVLVENLLAIPAGMALAEHAAGDHSSRGALVRRTAVSLSRTPMILAIVAGVAVSLLRIPLPEIVVDTVALFGQSTTAPALFVIGGLLVGQRMSGSLGTVAPLVVGKLLAHPIAVAALVYAFTAWGPALGLPTLSPEMRTAAILSAAAPTITILPVLAARHGEQDALSTAAFASTVLAAVTLTALLLLLGSLPGAGLG